MVRQISKLLTDAPLDLARDAVGVAALVVILFVGLHLPYLT
ncbi:MAG: hypothetical protein OIF47_06240 [Marinibacterium sp.]|nr:hypothetical protein [Marinibacterium sp.]